MGCLGSTSNAIGGTDVNHVTLRFNEAQLAAGICGLEAAAGCSYGLPTGEARSLFIYTKIAQPRLKLPRRPGMAQRHPLVCDLRRDKP